jgi:hypothetical protein
MSGCTHFRRSRYLRCHTKYPPTGVTGARGKEGWDTLPICLTAAEVLWNVLAVALSTQGYFWRYGGRLPAQLFWAHTCVRGITWRNFCYTRSDNTLTTCECLGYGWEWQQRSLATVERIVLPLVPLLPLTSLLYLVIFLNYDGYLVRWCCCSSWLGLFSSFGLCCKLAATVRATCSVQPLGQTLVVEV